MHSIWVDCEVVLGGVRKYACVHACVRLCETVCVVVDKWLDSVQKGVPVVRQD